MKKQDSHLQENDGSFPKRSNRRKKRRGCGIFAFIALALIVIIGFFAGDIYRRVVDTANQMYKDVDKDKDSSSLIKNREPISVLLLGVDNGTKNRPTDDGRSDTIIVVTINPETKQSTMVSIPRDTLVELQGRDGEFDKINHSYMLYGTAGAIKTVEYYLDMPIHYYVEVNMQGLMDIVSAVGGISITSSLTFEYQGNAFVKDETRILRGEEALAYSRMRYDDPEGDIGRSKRQQQVIQAILKKAKSLDTITNYRDVLEIIAKNAVTDFTLNDALILQSDYLPALDNMKRITMSNVTDLWLPEGYYMSVPESERLEIANILRANLGMPASTKSLEYLNFVISLYDDPSSVNILDGELNEPVQSENTNGAYEEGYQEVYQESYYETPPAQEWQGEVYQENTYQEQVPSEQPVQQPVESYQETNVSEEIIY